MSRRGRVLGPKRACAICGKCRYEFKGVRKITERTEFHGYGTPGTVHVDADAYVCAHHIKVGQGGYQETRGRVV